MKTKRLVFLAGLVFLACRMMAQESTSAHIIGIGNTNILDTYLSQEKYKGAGLTYLYIRERVKPEKHWSNVIEHELDISHADDRSSTTSELEASYNLYWGRYRSWRLFDDRLRLQAGGLVNGTLGFIYQMSNSNNPAQGRLGIDISASAGGSYRFKIRKLPVQVTYQADLPLMGCMFSPQFGQSYYDISQGSRNHNVCFSHPGNALCFRQLLTFDLEFNRASLRFGYMGDIRQSHVNSIRMHDLNHSFMIGYVRYLKVIKRNER